LPTINFEYGTARIYAVRAGGFSADREWASASSVRQRGLRWNKRDYQTILEWAEKRGAHPATVKATMRNDEPGVLRLDFEPKTKEDLERITWDKFFEKFDREKRPQTGTSADFISLSTAPCSRRRAEDCRLGVGLRVEFVARHPCC
jgi:hypothetical protein